jgi:hypothetical protein
MLRHLEVCHGSALPAALKAFRILMKGFCLHDFARSEVATVRTGNYMGWVKETLNHAAMLICKDGEFPSLAVCNDYYATA